MVGSVGTAAVLLVLGTYFDVQEKKTCKSSSLPPEMTAVFDRMITGKDNPTPKEIEAAKHKLRQGGK